MGICVGYEDDMFVISSVRWSLSVSMNPSSMYQQKKSPVVSLLEKNEGLLMSSTKSAICLLWQLPIATPLFC